MSGFRRPGTQHTSRRGLESRTHERVGEVWRVLGIVEGIDPERKTVTLWLQGMDGIGEVPISDTMPGWLLRPDTAFWATIPREYRSAERHEQVRWLDFEPVEYGYMNEQQLLDRLTGASDQLW